MSLSELEPVLTALVKDGSFGDFSFSGLETDVTEKGAQFASDVTFLNLILDGPNGKKVLPLVVKKTNLEAREAPKSDDMFSNEVAMYKEVLPGLGVGANFYPRMIYGLATNGAEPDKDILVLENLIYKNFHLPKTRLFLDIDHISLVIQKIAGFHSFSFIHKHNSNENFLKLTKKLKVIVSSPEIEPLIEKMSVACVERGIKPLMEENVSVDLLTSCFNFLNHPMKTRNLLIYPVEPFAVICHADLCNNNVLYKFDENGKPVDCVFFDFQYSMYASPAIDLFFFLYLNTTAELRDEYWDVILKLYWDTLRKSVPENIPIPSFEDFLKHFAERAIYGYTIASFFLPTMMEKVKESVSEDEAVSENEVQKLTFEEQIKTIPSIGGEAAQRKLSEIVLHLLNKGYISAYVELCKNKF